MCCVHVILRLLKRAAKSWTVFKAGALKTMTAPWRTARPPAYFCTTTNGPRISHQAIVAAVLSPRHTRHVAFLHFRGCTETNAEGGIGLPQERSSRSFPQEEIHCWFLAWPVAACNPIRGGPWLKKFHLANPAAATHFIQGGQEIYDPGLVTGWISSPQNLPDLVHQQRIETRLGIA